MQKQAKQHLNQYIETRDKLNELMAKGYPFGDKPSQKERIVIDMTRQLKEISSQ